MPARAHAAGAGTLRAAEAGAHGVRARPAPVQHHAATARCRHEGRPEDVRRELRVRALAGRQLLPVAAVPPPPRARAAALVTVPAGVGGPARAVVVPAAAARALAGPPRHSLDNLIS